MKYDKELTFAKELAHEAGTIMRRYFRAEDIGTEWKSDDTPLTVADTKINRMVIDRVKEAYPSHSVIGEEESYDNGGDYVWVVDPIDGTIPFSLGIPVSTFLLALVEKKHGQPVLGICYDPYLDHLYWAVEGQGAFLNDKPIKASSDKSLKRRNITLYGPIIDTERIYYSPGKLIDHLTDLGTRTMKISSGAYTASKIASGEFAIVTDAGGRPWDIAATAVIVKEAGGVASDLNGETQRFDEHSFGCVLAANKGVHAEFMKLIRKK